MLTYTRAGTEYAIDETALSGESLKYLLQYGFSQSLQDSIAGLAKAKAEELRETDDYKNGVMTDEDVDAEVALAIETKLKERRQAILDGTIGQKAISTPRDPLMGIAREQVRAAVKAKGAKVTKEKLEELAKAHLEKNREAIAAEHKRRVEANTVEVEIEI